MIWGDGGGFRSANFCVTGSPETVASANDKKLATSRTGIAWNNRRIVKINIGRAPSVTTGADLARRNGQDVLSCGRRSRHMHVAREPDRRLRRPAMLYGGCAPTGQTDKPKGRALCGDTHDTAPHL